MRKEDAWYWDVCPSRWTKMATGGAAITRGRGENILECLLCIKLKFSNFLIFSFEY